MATVHSFAIGAVIGLIIAALFAPFTIVASRAQKKAAAKQAAAKAAGTTARQSSMEPGLLARKKLGIWAFGSLGVFCGLFMVLGLLTQTWAEAIAFGLMGAFCLWLLLRLRAQIRRT